MNNSLQMCLAPGMAPSSLVWRTSSKRIDLSSRPDFTLSKSISELFPVAVRYRCRGKWRFTTKFTSFTQPTGSHTQPVSRSDAIRIGFLHTSRLWSSSVTWEKFKNWLWVILYFPWYKPIIISSVLYFFLVSFSSRRPDHVRDKCKGGCPTQLESIARYSVASRRLPAFEAFFQTPIIGAIPPHFVLEEGPQLWSNDDFYFSTAPPFATQSLKLPL